MDNDISLAVLFCTFKFDDSMGSARFDTDISRGYLQDLLRASFTFRSRRRNKAFASDNRTWKKASSSHLSNGEEELVLRDCLVIRISARLMSSL